MFNLKSRPARMTMAAAAISLMSVWVLSSAEEAPAKSDGPDAYGDNRSPMFGPRWGGGRGMARMTRHLDLSDEQRTRIEAILTDSRAKAQTLNENLKELRQQLHAEVIRDEYYEDQVRILIESQAPAMVELMLLGTKTMHAVRAELTPEQRAEAEAMMQRFKRHGPRHGKGRRHGRFGPQGDGIG